MKTRSWCLSLLIVLCLTSSLLADEKAKPAAPGEQAMMEAWMKAATPGEAHKKLQPFIGTFDVKVRNWMAPGAPVMESAGVSESRWVLDGRWVEQRFTGTFMNQPFHGIGYTGYDNVKKTYVGTWMDNMSTSVMVSSGKADGNAMNFESTMADPMTGKDAPIKEKITVKSDDEHVLEMWGPAPDGTMFKSMEIVYTRKK
jgi:hypothetical protein